MTKNKPIHFQKRDWAIALLFVAVIATNWVWWETSKGQDITNRSTAESWLQQEIEIGKLKSCIDNGTRPCDISVPRP